MASRFLVLKPVVAGSGDSITRDELNRGKKATDSRDGRAGGQNVGRKTFLGRGGGRCRRKAAEAGRGAHVLPWRAPKVPVEVLIGHLSQPRAPRLVGASRHVLGAPHSGRQRAALARAARGEEDALPLDFRRKEGPHLRGESGGYGNERSTGEEATSPVPKRTNPKS